MAFWKTSLTVYPCYFGDPLTGERTEYVYCEDVKGLVTTQQLKGYNVYHKSDFYYDALQERLIDFNALIEGLEAETATLRWIAEERSEWFKEESDRKRSEFASIRPSGIYKNSAPKSVQKAKTVAKVLTGTISDLLKRKKK